MDENKSVITGEFDRTGRYDSGLQSLTRSLKAAFMLLLIGILATLIYFFSGAGYFSVEPQQAVIVTRFGKVVECFTTGGHWFLPYPVSQFIRVQTSRQLLNVDFAPQNAASGEERSSLEPGVDNYLLTGDANIVHSSWTIAYRVSNPEKYYETLLTPLMPIANEQVSPDDVFTDADGMKGTRGPVTMLTNLFRRAVIAVTGKSLVGDILYAKQSEYNEAVRREFTDLVNAADCGITVETVGLNRIYPPLRTKSAFDEVTAAANTRSALRNEAAAYRVEVENETKASEAALLADAENYRTRVRAKIEADQTYFTKIYEQYKTHPDTVTMALYTAALEEVAGNLSEDKFIMGSQTPGKQLWLKLNPEPKKSAPVKAGEDK